MVWTLLLVLTVSWLLAMLAGAGDPWSWLLPAAAALLLFYRVLRASTGR